MQTRYFKKTAIAVALIAGMTAVGTAQADSLAQSVLSLTNFQFLKGTTTTSPELSLGDLTPGTFIQDSTSLSAGLNGGSNSNTPSPTFGGVPLGYNQVCFPAACPAGLNAGNPSSFSPITAGPVPTTGALSASNLTGAPVNGIPGVPGGGATAQTAALAEYKGTGTGKSASELDLATIFSFTLASATAVTIDFNVALNEFMWVNNALPSSAQTGSGWNITITTGSGPTLATVFSWAPDGKLGTGITGGTESADGCNLQTSFTQFGAGQQSGGTCSGRETATTNVLGAGIAYTLTLTHTTSASVVSVPEPESVLLMGLGVAGLALARRRKVAKA